MIGLLCAASIAITGPEDHSTVPPGDVHITLSARGAPQGAHVHLILDKGPALEVELANFHLVLHEVPKGAHTLRAVLVDKSHIAYKRVSALSLSRFWVGPPDDDPSWPDPKKPILTLVMPSGTGLDPPLLDVHLRGATLSRRGYKVRIVVDKKELPLLTEEKPRKLKLGKGKHSITVDLLDRRGTTVANVVNRTDRVFDVK